MKKNTELELTVTDLAFGGKGIAKIDGLAVFIDQTVPGDRVRARIVKKKKNYAEARVIEILDASRDRVDAPCPYSGICGGCKWQFFRYEKQLEYKERHVRESFIHIGGIHDLMVHPTLGSENVFGYRNKMEFSCSDLRWRMPHELGLESVDTDFAVGLHVPGTFHKVLDIDACLLQPAEGNAILDVVKKYLGVSGRPLYNLRSHEGYWRFLMLRHSVARDQWLVNIVTSQEDRDAVMPLAAMLAEQFPNIACVVNNITSRPSGVAFGEYEIHLLGEPCLRERLGNYEFEISANSFFQTNTRGAALLYDMVKAYAGLSGDETVLDLYSGTGTIPIWLSGQARAVLGIEIVESAVEDALRNCRQNQVENCRFLVGDIRETLQQINTRPDVMIIDPPRTGMHKDVVAQVLAMGPEKIVYVSCNPATLARDAALVNEVYRVVEVQPVDMFPHTFHIEAVARFEKR